MKLPWIVGGVLVATMLAVLTIGMIEEYKWQTWADEHCRKIGSVSSSVGFGPVIGGKGGVSTVFIPGKTGYQCDDGQQYWR